MNGIRVPLRLSAAIGCVALFAQSVSGQSVSQQAALVIGELDAPESHVFGSIVAVEVSSKGEVFILDGMTSALRWFAGDGTFQSSAGREGGGPGEFRVPSALALDGAGVLNVLDPGNLKIAKFRVVADSLEHVGDQRVGPAFDLCIIGDRRLILFPSDSGVVHEIDSTGAIVNSFGLPLTVSQESRVLPADLRMELLNRGDLVCDAERNRVVIASERSGRVAAYDLSGRLAWQAELSEFKPVRWVAVSGGRFQMAGDPDTGVASTVKSIAIGASGEIYVTVHEGSLEDPEGRLHATILDGRTGREVRSEPAQAAWVQFRQGALYGIQEQPYPRVIKVLVSRR